jgi:hypothetical protein
VSLYLPIHNSIIPLIISDFVPTVKWKQNNHKKNVNFIERSRCIKIFLRFPNIDFLLISDFKIVIFSC